MTARRLISVLSVGLLASASVVVAQPKTPAGKKPSKGTKGPLAPAKDGATPAKGGSAGSAAKGTAGSAAPATTGAGEGSAVQMTEDPPPADINGIDENPDAPKSVIDSDAPTVTAAAPVQRPRSGYPIEAVLRPITLPQNMSEVSINPHGTVSPSAAATALRARYGITPRVQLGLTYMLGGIFDDPSTLQSSQAFHPGKAVGLDLTVMLQDWIGVQVGVPVYISPLAVSVTVGAPIKFTFGDKYAIGGLDDLLNIRISKFAPTFYQELQNATNAADTMINTIKSQGELRVSLFGIYQYQPNLAFIGRAGIQMEDFASGKTDGCNGECLTTFIYAAMSYSPRRYLDLGLSIGFDDLAHGGSFAPAGFLAVRI
jgi:hypothetical protein